MESRCFLLCPGCGREHEYVAGDELHCTFCGEPMSVEEGIRPLVMVLNNLGIRTHMSCEGGGFDDGKWGFPWITFREDAVEQLRTVLDRTGIPWAIECILPREELLWLVPKEKYRSFNIKEMYSFARRICKASAATIRSS